MAPVNTMAACVSSLATRESHGGGCSFFRNPTECVCACRSLEYSAGIADMCWADEGKTALACATDACRVLLVKVRRAVLCVVLCG